MKNVEMVIERIEELEESNVIVNVKINGEVVSFEMVEEDNMANIEAFEVATVEAYEENGYETEGLVGEWVEL